ncbi:MBL fold metallo-hydrolase [Alteromonas flava]|uniref:MBL fold metallo-hydrolase n=1 Tax=Alteromonas flava TaxID=2048003 RepID=UPI0013DC3EB7|nr:MBL fold metallo-hydrolase [Alteromonas flava]
MKLKVVRWSLLLALLINLQACSSKRPPEWFDPTQAHHLIDADGNVSFRNIYLNDKDKSFFDFLEMRYFGDESWAEHSKLADTVPLQQVDVSRIQQPPDTVQVTWLGHSTFLIQYQGINILTDPIFSDRASPLSFMGPRRYVPHVIDYKQLPPIDAVVISHSHYDHLDEATIKQLGNRPTYYVPLGLKTWFVDNGVNETQVNELDWQQTAIFNQDLRVVALPSQHWSARSLGDRFATLWASWGLVFSDFTLWFAGDTGYHSELFKPIGTQLGVIDLALIPIGAYAPRWFMQDYHVNPEEAVKIHDDIGAKQSIGMHWGTFPLTAEPPIEPQQRLYQVMQARQEALHNFITIDLGESYLVMDKAH